eukprot:TRINITY_DN1921_c0_g1_i1.p1 TRINITY_DN1921_c0_g1~~TRINITY_DN1921_c0_g1_i1.p1  ORF type:complete len:135 (+),score=37.97 TRINITY_DN1921_c0_g1_i1:51-455(+)
MIRLVRLVRVATPKLMRPAFSLRSLSKRAFATEEGFERKGSAEEAKYFSQAEKAKLLKLLEQMEETISKADEVPVDTAAESTVSKTAVDDLQALFSKHNLTFSDEVRADLIAWKNKAYPQAPVNNKQDNKPESA